MDPRLQTTNDDDRHEDESDGLANGWYRQEGDDPHEPDDDEIDYDQPDHPRM
jgi:hypothetical protein